MGLMSIDKSINLFVGLAVLFAIVAALYPTTSSYGDQLNTSGFPLGSIFVGGGVIFIIIAAAIIRGVVSNAKGGR